ncbi:MAG TPA: 4Fe-4S binding protein [Actinotalea sp.]|nr:4Fe-4S binding protein [Actinotalea sp.]
MLPAHLKEHDEARPATRPARCRAERPSPLRRWPVIPIVFVLLGRFWCAVCPFGLVSDTIQKWVGVNRPVPNFLKNYGIWIIDASFLAITWADHVWGVVESPWGSGVLLLLLTTAVIASGALFQRRTFCRYLCFLGGLSGNYARTGMVELRADTGICRTCKAKAVCYNGTDKVAGCLWLCDFSGGPSLDLDGGSSSVIVTALASVREGLPTVEGAEQRTLADDEDLGPAVRLDACGDCFWCLADCPP